MPKRLPPRDTRTRARIVRECRRTVSTMPCTPAATGTAPRCRSQCLAVQSACVRRCGQCFESSGYLAATPPALLTCASHRCALHGTALHCSGTHTVAPAVTAASRRCARDGLTRVRHSSQPAACARYRRKAEPKDAPKIRQSIAQARSTRSALSLRRGAPPLGRPHSGASQQPAQLPWDWPGTGWRGRRGARWRTTGSRSAGRRSRCPLARAPGPSRRPRRASIRSTPLSRCSSTTHPDQRRATPPRVHYRSNCRVSTVQRELCFAAAAWTSRLSCSSCSSSATASRPNARRSLARAASSSPPPPPLRSRRS